MCMFQIITQEGWPGKFFETFEKLINFLELVVDVLRMTDDRMVPFVAIYFVAYHLFVTLVCLTLILDLNMDFLDCAVTFCCGHS